MYARATPNRVKERRKPEGRQWRQQFDVMVKQETDSQLRVAARKRNKQTSCFQVK